MTSYTDHCIDPFTTGDDPETEATSLRLSILADLNVLIKGMDTYRHYMDADDLVGIRQKLRVIEQELEE